MNRRTVRALGFWILAIAIGCTPALKNDIRTEIADVTKECQSGAPQSVAILIDPTTGEVVQIACVAEEDLAPLVQRLLEKRRALIRARLGQPSTSPSTSAPSASADSSTGY